MGERGLTDCDFTTRVLECMFFTGFVQERGPPWRPCDVWDELYSNIGEHLRQESQDQRLLLVHIQVWDYTFSSINIIVLYFPKNEILNLSLCLRSLANSCTQMKIQILSHMCRKS